MEGLAFHFYKENSRQKFFPNQSCFQNLKSFFHSHSIDAQFETLTAQGIQRDKNDCVKYVSQLFCAFTVIFLILTHFVTRFVRGLLPIKYVIRTNTSPLSHTLFTIFFCSVIGSVNAIKYF
jgi:hypothetical protein